ncbi:unnamed protein product [Arctia plantaginis]|uniref:Trichohyalin-like n=1 Tax=Arctia plantaginis TaxID=874455 RepID=A0A8S0ZKX9_ARCPL|nr:unnamed protein product [Arctia plantaginis]
MNNWRLLLLALVAVFQPITSFTERSLVDGRQQCCDRQTDTLLRDLRPNLYVNNRLAKPFWTLHRLNFRDETREDRQLRQRVTLFPRRSTERSLENIRERNLKQSPLITSRFTRVDYRTVVSDVVGRTNEALSRYSQSRDDSRINRLSNERQDREMQLNGRTNKLLSRYSQSRDKSRINRLINERQDRVMQRDVRTNEFLSRYSQAGDESRINRLSNERQDREMQRNGRANEFTSRYSQYRDESRINRLSNERQDREMQSNARTNELLSRYSQSRDESRINRLSNERQDREISKTDRMEFRSETVHRMTSTRASRDSLWMQRVAEDRTRVYHESRLLLERERVNKPTHERREQERHAEQRRSLSENSNVINRVRDMGVNFRDQKRENRARSAVSLQHSNAHRQSRATVKENTDLSVSDERMLLDRREIESRLINGRNVRDRVVENRRDTRLTERLSKETHDVQFVQESRVESRASRRTAERDSRVTDQRARSRNIQNFRDARSDSKLSLYDNTLRGSDASRSQTAYRGTMANRDRNIVDNRFRNVESARARDNSIIIQKLDTENELISNWQYIFYSIQAAYICGFVIQTLTPNRYEKSKMGSVI